MTWKRHLKNKQRLLKRRFSGVPIQPWQHKYRTIFIHVPKCAGTSLLEAFGHRGKRDHGRWIDYKRSDLHAFQSYFKFAFVRSPSTRLYSAYQYLRGNGNGSKRDIQLAKYLKVKECNFSEFVLYSITPQILKSELLFWEQSCYVFDKKNRLMVDYLGKVETLDQDMKIIMNHLDLPLVNPVPTSNQSRPLTGNIDEKVIERICHLYSRDIQLLDYKF